MMMMPLRSGSVSSRARQNRLTLKVLPVRSDGFRRRWRVSGVGIHFLFLVVVSLVLSFILFIYSIFKFTK